jgi:energy-coupling factor transport system ATP-binding protein
MPGVAARLTAATLQASGAAAPFVGPLDLAVERGTLTVVLGPSGAGKTSLLELAAGLRRPAAGSVAIFGEALSSPRKLSAAARSRVAYLFQAPERMFFRATIGDELKAALRERGLDGDEVASRMTAALASVGLPPTVLERAPGVLSGGQQRLVALAIVLALRPDLLVLDEPTAGLDADHADAVRSALTALRDAGAAVLVATHDVDHFVPVADRVVCLAAGRLVAAGPPREVFAHPETLLAAGIALPFATRAGYALGLEGRVALTTGELADRIVRDRPAGARAALPATPPWSARPSPAGKSPALLLPLIPSLLASLLVGVAFLVPAPLPLLACYALGLIGLGAAFGARPRALLRGLLPVLVLGAMAASLHLIAPGGDWRIPPPAPTASAWSAAARSFLRVVGPVLAAMVFCLPTHPALLLRDLGSLLRAVPLLRRRAAELPLALALVLRLAPQLADTARTFERAGLARGVKTPGGLAGRIRGLVELAAPLLLVTIQRSSQLAAALYLRGMSEGQTPPTMARFGRTGLVFSIGSLAAFLAAVATAV